MYYEAHHPITNEVISIVWKHDGLFSFIPLDEGNTDFQNYLFWLNNNDVTRWNPAEHDLPIATPDGN
jgi:hypothetical protein